MTPSPLVTLSRTDGTGGGKVGGLRWLLDHGFPVPPTWVVADPAANPIALHAAVSSIIESGRSYAVRSSANVEDGGAISYAGQFRSELDVRGAEAVLAAVGRVAESATADAVTAYRRHIGDERPVRMSVIIQQMVPPVWSGVAFSRNPITGLGEIVVEAVAGSGEALLAGGASPQRWVRRWGDYVERPEAATVARAVIDEVVAGVERIAHRYDRPVDVEWVHDGEKLWWVQVRAISGLEDIAIYSRRISKEVMPGIIKPLVWSVNVPMVNQAWIDLFREAVGDVAIEPEDLARSFGYRSYFNMTAIGEIFAAMGLPRESLELLLGLPPGSDQPRFKPSLVTVGKLPRMLRMALSKSRYDREVAEQLPALQAEYDRFAGRNLRELSDGELIADIRALSSIGVRAASANIVTPLLANIYSALLRRRLAKSAIDLESIDLLEDMPELAAVDPNPHLEAIAGKIRSLDRSQREAILRDGHQALPDGLRAEVDDFLQRFGHLSDSGNDFSVAPWREQPDTVVGMAAARPERTRSTARQGWEAVEGRLPVWRRPVARALRRRTRRFIELRERVSSTYTHGYGLFRGYFLEIGRRLADRGYVGAAADVMYLTFDEVVAALLDDEGASAAHLVARRKAEIEQIHDLELPEVIYGDDFIPRQADDSAATSWHGVPTARGHHRGPVRIVHGIADFDKVQPGDVLAIPYSDVGWTPLFAKAGAVVAESGGMLSHSSIVAREYGIPCVVSVPGAMRMPEGAVVTVDGYRGVVVLDGAAS